MDQSRGWTWGVLIVITLATAAFVVAAILTIHVRTADRFNP
jgi:uncharacterized protein YpmS